MNWKQENEKQRTELSELELVSLEGSEGLESLKGLSDVFAGSGQRGAGNVSLRV